MGILCHGKNKKRKKENEQAHLFKCISAAATLTTLYILSSYFLKWLYIKHHLEIIIIEELEKKTDFIVINQ